MNTFERIEIKYILNKTQYQKVIENIKDYMTYGPYGIYNICNLYYDTDSFQLIRDSLDKPLFKEKLRLRSYGLPNKTDNVFLEAKRKFQKTVYKRRFSFPYEYLDNIFENQSKSQIQKELNYFVNFYHLIPKVFLSYDREEFIDKKDNSFRLTFDSNVIARTYDVSFDYGIYGENVLPNETYIMEIKVSHNLPLWFVNILNDLNIYPSSFSKYGEFYKKFVFKGDLTYGI